MANPRQRRKARSSTHHPVSHSRHAKRNLKKMPPLRAPKVLQDAWDKHKTVKQNYASLGLVRDLNPNAPGGCEEPSHSVGQHVEQSTLQVESTSSAQSGMGRIIRDESGAVIGVELLDAAGGGSLNNSNELPQPEVDGSHLTRWATHLGQQGNGSATHGENSVVEALERISAPTSGSRTLSAAISGVGARSTAGGERIYLERLVQKYESDVEKMSRDRKLNPEQRTAGELRRALRRAGL